MKFKQISFKPIQVHEWLINHSKDFPLWGQQQQLQEASNIVAYHQLAQMSGHQVIKEQTYFEA